MIPNLIGLLNKKQPFSFIFNSPRLNESVLKAPSEYIRNCLNTIRIKIIFNSNAAILYKSLVLLILYSFSIFVEKMDCPKCKSSSHNKDGIVNYRQRYLCKQCGYRYTVAKKSDVKSAETKRLALEMYLEGLGFRAIGRILKISYGTVYQWVKEWAAKWNFRKAKLL